VHRVEEKHEVGGNLIGNPRVIIAANRDDALPLGGHHTRDHIDAIAQRVLHIETSHAPVTWDEAAGWLGEGESKSGGRIAEHVLWLHENRAVTKGGRFLVEGVETEWHRGLMLRSGHNAQVLAAVGKATLGTVRRNPPREGACLYKRGEEVVYINASRLHSQWQNLVDEDRVRPTRSAVARTLKELSESGKSVSKRDRAGLVLRWWCVPVDLVLRVAAWHGIPGFEQLENAFAGREVTQGEAAQGTTNAPGVI